MDGVGFIELEGKGTPINIIRDPVEVATACNVLQKVGHGIDVTHSWCCWCLRFHCRCTACLAMKSAV